MGTKEWARNHVRKFLPNPEPKREDVAADLVPQCEYSPMGNRCPNVAMYVGGLDDCGYLTKMCEEHKHLISLTAKPLAIDDTVFFYPEGDHYIIEFHYDNGDVTRHSISQHTVNKIARYRTTSQ